MSYWVTFTDGSEGCIVCPADHQGPFSRSDAERIARKLDGNREVESVEHLPYDANPVINNQPAYPLCYSPRECKGRTSCPKRRACSE